MWTIVTAADAAGGTPEHQGWKAYDPPANLHGDVLVMGYHWCKQGTGELLQASDWPRSKAAITDCGESGRCV